MREEISSGNRLDILSGNESNALEAQSSINEVYNIYFPIFSIFKHVHVVTYSFKVGYGRKLIISILENLGFRFINKQKPKKGNYLMKSRYEKNTMVVEFMYQLKKEVEERNYSHPSFLMYVHNPTREFIDVLVSFCKYEKLEGLVSRIELAFDFFTADIVDMFDFLKSCLFMRYQRSRSCEDKYPFTFYANDIKRQSRGLKVYYRNGRKYVRLELTLKRTVIKKLGIDMSLSKVESINPLDYFTFMKLDEKWFREYIIGQNREEIARMKKESRYGGDLCYCHIESWLSSWPLAPESLMGSVDVLKSKISGIKNYMRFLIPLNDFIEIFLSAIEGQLFIPNQAEWENSLNLCQQSIYKSPVLKRRIRA